MAAGRRQESRDFPCRRNCDIPVAMITRLTFAVLLCLAVTACERTPDVVPAELVITGAHVDTMNPAAPTAQAIAVRAGRIVFVGDDAGAKPFIGEKTRVVPADGASVLPGLIDAHIHLMEGALVMDDCSFDDAQLTLAQMAPIIRECAARKPGTGWVTVQELNGAGFNATLKDLDGFIADRPLVLFTADGHSVWVNSRALALAGIDRRTPDPPEGKIEHDKHGEPTGFIVDKAVNLVIDRIPKPGEPERQALLLRGLHDIAADGITTIMEANTSAETVSTYVGLAKSGRLKARVSMALGSNGEPSDQEFARLDAVRKLAAGVPQIRADFIKLFADGVIEYPTQSGSLLSPYTDAQGKTTSNLGPTYLPAAQLAEFVQRADRNGFNVHIHVIGDRATRMALDAFATAREHGSKRLYSLAHLEMVDPADAPRFRALDVIACMQLQWARPDNYSVDAVLPYIGAERQARLYPAGTLARAGATISGGSDWNVSTFNPFEAMSIAMSRTNPAEPQRGALGAPEEKLTLRQMLLAYTVNAARQLGIGNEVGSIETGKAADLVILDRRLTEESSAADVLATRVRYTFADGAQLIGPAP
jgi:predicted amidohydrolase YtcJ